MKLKPGSFQLIVVMMILSLITSCGQNPHNQADCNNQPKPQAEKATNPPTNQLANDCQPNSSGSSRTGTRIRSSGGGSSVDAGDSSSSSTKSRGGFGSFGRGGSGGG